MEDSTRIAQAFFTANYVAKYYSSIISDKFNGRINPIVDVEAKPDFTKFLFSVDTKDNNKDATISDFLKFLSDTVSFNSRLFDANKADIITQYNQNQLNELQYRIGKQPKIKYLNSISITKLKQFYKDWYRPNITSVIIVGNLDIEKIRKEVRDNFSKLKNPLKEKPILYYGIPKKSSLQFIISDDSTFTDNGLVQFYFKTFRNNRATLYGYNESTIGKLTSFAYNKISDDFILQNNITKLNTTTSYQIFSKNEDAFVINTSCNKNYIDTLVIELLNFAEKINLSEIFSTKQLDLSKAKHLDNLFKNKTLVESSNKLANNCTEHFIYNLPLIDNKVEYEFAKSFIDKITNDNIKSLFLNSFKQENTIIVIKKPKDKKMLFNTKSELLKKYNEVFPKK